MSKAVSQDSNPVSRIKQFIMPSGLELLLYALIAFLILVAFNASEIWRSFDKSLLITANNAQDSVAINANSGFWDEIANSRIPQIVFWALIGIVMYTIVWFVWNIITNLRNDVAADQFVHPRHYSRSKYWQTVLSRKIFFGIIVLVFIVYTLLFFKFTSLISNLAYSASDPLVIPSGLAELGIYVLLTLGLIYALVVLARLVAHSWRAVYKDL